MYGWSNYVSSSIVNMYSLPAHPQVATEHLLLGLVEEETAPTSAAKSTSYLGVTGLTLERLTRHVKAAAGTQNSNDSGAINQFGFAKDARRTFEAAANVGVIVSTSFSNFKEREVDKQQ